MVDKVIFITTVGTGTFIVPTDFGSLVSVEAIGGGGSGNQSGVATTNGAGGGGSYAKSISITGLTAGGTAYYRVGAGGGTTSTNGTSRSWFYSTSTYAGEPPTTLRGVLAEGGGTATGAAGGLGGSTTVSIGDTKFAGGTAGTVGGIGVKAGGGGAGGPNGAGGAGGGGTGTAAAGGGGGAGGASTTAGSAGTAGGVGGNGGSGPLGTGGGGGGNTGSGSAGTSGTGGGGGGGGSTSPSSGGAGATYNYWTQTSNGATAGPGGGGGGGQAGGGNGGGGALYGGGGGGTTTAGAIGVGAQGIIVFTYSPIGVPMARLTNTGTLYLNANTLVNSKINEVTVSTMRMNPSNFYAGFFDEINGVINILGTSAAQSGTSSIGLSSAAGTIVGDLLMAFLASDNGAGTFTVPSGWTAVENIIGKSVMYKYADATDVGGITYTFTNSSASTVDGYLVTFRNAAYDTTGGLGSFGNTTTGDITLPSVAVTRGIAIVVGHIMTTDLGPLTYTIPGGLASNPTIGFTQLGLDADLTGPCSVLFYCRVPYAGPTGDVVSTVSPAIVTGIGSLFSIIPTGSGMQVTNTGTVFVGQFIDESTVLSSVTPII